MLLQKASRNGGIMEHEIIHINDYVSKLISDGFFLKEEYSKYVRNSYGLENVFGIIHPNILSTIIRKAKYNRKMRYMLSDILLYSDNTSITDANFRSILKFPPKWKTTYLSSLGHCKLAFYQMQILNRYPLALEAFSWLFDQVCQYDLFSDEDMVQILRDNPSIQSIAVQNCIDTAYSKYGPSSKLEIAKQWIDACFR